MFIHPTPRFVKMWPVIKTDIGFVLWVIIFVAVWAWAKRRGGATEVGVVLLMMIISMLLLGRYLN